MSLLRAFIAIEIPPEIKQAISTHTVSLHKASGQAVRWVAAENLHLTLKFLGEISAANVATLVEALKVECLQQPPFELMVENLGCFPNPRNPRVIWIGLQAPAQLGRLQHHIENITTRLGYAVEDKPFAPHLTIGRLREHVAPPDLQALRNLLLNPAFGRLGNFTAREVQLFKSELRPGGPIYTRLSTAPLAAT